MFPIDYQVNVRSGKGDVRRYTLLENQGDKFLIVIHPDIVREMTAYVNRGNPLDEDLISLLADEAMVLDRKKGSIIPQEQALTIMAKSEHLAIQRAAVLRAPLGELKSVLSGEDLAWAFSLEVAKRRLASA